jgi:hypothetical protein
MSIRWLFALVLALALALPQLSRTAAAPAFSHIYIIMEENASYEDIIGNTADLPYINSLAQTYGFAANYYGVTHTSVPNYIAATAGDIFGSHKDDASQVFDAKNIVDQLESKGLTWATYQEGLPSVGFTGTQDPPTGTGLYVKKHNPFVFFPDIANNPTRLQNVKPMDSLATDLSSGNAPNYSFIVPNNCHNMHGVSPPASVQYNLPWCGYPPNFTINHTQYQMADAYAKQLITTIMSSKAWTADSIIVLTWDENESSGRPLTGPNRGYASSTGCCASPAGDGGGRVPTIVITNTPTHSVSLRPYNHYSLLLTVENNWGLGCLANTCNSAVQPMTDLIPQGAGGSSIPLDQTGGFAVTFYSKNPGQGYVLFGPSCSALVEIGTRDLGAGTTTHTVLVQGNDMPGTVGDIGLSPGVDYYYESVTSTASGNEVDNNGGNCYVQTISQH